MPLLLLLLMTFTEAFSPDPTIYLEDSVSSKIFIWDLLKSTYCNSAVLLIPFRGILRLLLRLLFGSEYGVLRIGIYICYSDGECIVVVFITSVVLETGGF